MPREKKSREKARIISEKLYAGRSAIQLAILGMLRRQPECGYIIAKSLRAKHESLDIQYGALYPILERMARRGLIRGRWEEGRGKYGRKVYELTPAGRKTLQTTQKSWLRLIEQVKSLISVGV